MGIAGIVIISLSAKPWTSGSTAKLSGIILLISANISGSLSNILVAKAKVRTNPIILNSAQISFGGILLFILSIPIEGLPDVSRFTGEFYISLIWLTFISAAAFSIWFSQLQKPEVKVSNLNIWKFIIPVFGAIISWTMMPNEHPSWLSITGMICVGSSILFTTILKNSDA